MSGFPLTPPPDEGRATDRDVGDGYLSARDEWSGPSPLGPSSDESDRAVSVPSRGVRSPEPTADQQRSRRGRVRLVGVARAVEVGAGERGDVLSFRVDRFDTSGNRLQPAGVELRGYRHGRVSDGEEVEVVGRWNSGTIQADRVLNRTTGADVGSWPAWGRRLVATVAILFAVAVLAFVAYGFVITVLGG